MGDNRLNNKQHGVVFKWIESVKNFGKINVFYGLLLFLTVNLFTLFFAHYDTLINKVIDDKGVKETKLHSENVTTRRNINVEVNSLLKSLLISTNADRVFIGEYHNGTVNSGGLSFIYLTITYEQLNRGVTPISSHYEKRPLSTIPLLCELYDKRLMTHSIQEIEELDPVTHYLLKQNGVEYICLIEISSVIDGIEEELGFLGLTYLNADKCLKQDELMKEMLVKSQTISSLLNFNKKKK